MKINQTRRKLNDSKVGQKINGSMPGILVEGVSRGISDTGRALGDYAIAGIAFGGALLTARKRPLNALALVGLGAVSYALAGIDPETENADTHYSHTSRLYEKAVDSEGKDVMKRVPVGEALIEKVAEHSPKLALSLAMRMSKPSDIYRY